MSEDLLQQISGRFDVEEIVSKANNDPKIFRFYAQHLMENSGTSWRAAWVINHATWKKDNRIAPFISDIINSIEGKKDGHQRELLKIVAKQPLSEEQEGYFFDVCMNLWQDVNKQAAVRYYCMIFIHKMSEKYPEIENELEYLLGDYYTKTLSSGIQRSLFKKIGKRI